MPRIAVVDLGTGNLHSVAKALEHVAPAHRVEVSSDPLVIDQADQVVLPGQGAVGTWLNTLLQGDLKDAILVALDSRPVLGICLGLQALYDSSEEDGGKEGLCVLAGKVRRFPSVEAFDSQIKVPHMGWNNVRQVVVHPLWQGIEQDSRFYFVHSYYAESASVAEVFGTTDYGVQFTSAAGRKNVFAVQFHPEKSHNQGLALLRNFVHWDGGV